MNPNSAAVAFVVCMWDEATGFSAVNIHTVQEVALAPAEMFCSLFAKPNKSLSDLTPAPVTNVQTVNCELAQQHLDPYTL